MPFRGRERFDAGLVLAQIVLLQAAFYLSYTALLLALDRLLRVDARVSAQVFDHRALALREPGGRVAAAAMFAADVPTAFAYAALVGRSKPCLDFACTLFIAHVVATVLHSGWPDTFAWWALNAASVAVLVSLCEWLCMRIEMQEIQVSGSGASSDGMRKIGSSGHSLGVDSDEKETRTKPGRLVEANNDLEDPLLERAK